MGKQISSIVVYQAVLVIVHFAIIAQDTVQHMTLPILF